MQKYLRNVEATMSVIFTKIEFWSFCDFSCAFWNVSFLIFLGGEMCVCVGGVGVFPTVCGEKNPRHFLGGEMVRLD
jgi:hypothetical protein